jgi:HD-like signal output (HDOD) protein
VNTEAQILEDLQNDIENNRLVLPTLPEVALRVRDAVEDENATAGTIADIVATDAALSTRLLQIANSPLYRARSPIDNIQTAIARLGNVQVRNLVSSLVMQQMFQATNDLLDARLRRLWEHSSEVAAICMVMAMQTRGLQKDQAMLAGLIHDIGALPILVHAEDMPELLENEEMLDAIVASLHPRLGEIILNNWGFPEHLVKVAAHHEDLDYTHDGEADYVDLVIVANLQSHIDTGHPHAQTDWSKVSAFQRLGIDTEINIVDIEENKEQIDEMKAALG